MDDTTRKMLEDALRHSDNGQSQEASVLIRMALAAKPAAKPRPALKDAM